MKHFLFKLYQISLLIQVCWGAHAWFTWNWDFYSSTQRFLIYFIFVLIAYSYKLLHKVKIKPNIRNIAIIVFMFFALSMRVSTFNGFLFYFMFVLPFYVLLNDHNSLLHLKFLSQAIAIIFLPGLFFHFFLIPFGIFRGIPIQYGDSTSNLYNFYNYFVMIVYERNPIRFCSIFLEPGYLGTLVAFLLYSNRYDFKKWYNIVLLIGLLASLSLAGYITALLGYLLKGQFKRQLLLKRVVLISLILGGFYYFALNYNGGKNIINESIIERLQLTNDEKIISGNNRVFGNTDEVFEQFIKSGNIWFGLESVADEEVFGAGYKVFLLYFGLLTALLWFLTYLLICTSCKNKKYGYVFLFLIILTFLQAAYPSSYAWLIPVILGIRSREKLLL